MTTQTTARIAEQTTQRSHPSPMKCKSAVTMRLRSVKGSVNFQAKFINWSWRRRGRVPRIQMKTKMERKILEKNQIQEGTQVRKENGADQPPRKRVVPRPEMENMARY